MPAIAASRVRIARPTVDLVASRHFYEHLIGLPVLAEFADHEGFDGVVFALSGRVQFELVTDPHDHAPAPTVEDLLVLSLDEATTADVTNRLTEYGVIEVMNGTATVNPYWWRAGARVFVDPDGYRVLIVPQGAL
jgi:catechol 2,3-dioxygenase-like lactoylglutathione lyase family enzyme